MCCRTKQNKRKQSRLWGWKLAILHNRFNTLQQIVESGEEHVETDSNLLLYLAIKNFLSEKYSFKLPSILLQHLSSKFFIIPFNQTLYHASNDIGISVSTTPSSVLTAVAGVAIETTKRITYHKTNIHIICNKRWRPIES